MTEEVVEVIDMHIIGMWGARIGDRIFDKTQHTTPGGTKINKTGIVPSVCRDLIAEGVGPDTLIRVYSSTGVVSFHPAKIGDWAKLKVVEPFARSVRFAPYNEHPFAKQQKEEEE